MFKKEGFYQALGVALYCTLVGTFLANAGRIFPGPDRAYTPILVLLIFSTSVLICTILVFLQPYRLFFDGKKKEAIDLVVSTAVWMFVFVLLFMSMVAIYR